MTYKEAQAATFALAEKDAMPLIKTMLDNYTTARDAIITELENIYIKYLTGAQPKDYYNLMIQYDRYSKLLEQVQGQYNYYAKLSGKQTTQISSIAMSNTYYRQQYILNWFSGLSSDGIQLNFSILNPKLLKLTVTGTQEAWKAIKDKQLASVFAPQYGSLSELLKKNQYNDLSSIQKTITQAFIQGKSIKDMTADIMGVFDTAAFQAERIARTEFTRCSNSGDYAATLDAADQGLNVTREWMATLDARTRDSHQRLDGKKVAIDEPFEVDGDEAMFPGDFADVGNNVNCRCTTITLIDGVEPELRRSGNEVFSFKNYDEWATGNGLKQSKTGEYLPV